MSNGAPSFTFPAIQITINAQKRNSVAVIHDLSQPPPNLSVF
jgi:hypothetical protein